MILLLINLFCLSNYITNSDTSHQIFVAAISWWCWSKGAQTNLLHIDNIRNGVILRKLWIPKKVAKMFHKLLTKLQWCQIARTWDSSQVMHSKNSQCLEKNQDGWIEEETSQRIQIKSSMRLLWQRDCSIAFHCLHWPFNMCILNTIVLQQWSLANNLTF